MFLRFLCGAESDPRVPLLLEKDYVVIYVCVDISVWIYMYVIDFCLLLLLSCLPHHHGLSPLELSQNKHIYVHTYIYELIVMFELTEGIENSQVKNSK